MRQLDAFLVWLGIIVIGLLVFDFFVLCRFGVIADFSGSGCFLRII